MWSAGTSSTNTIRALVALGRIDEAYEVLERHRSFLPRIPVPLVEVELRCFECTLALLAGRFDEAEEAATRARDVGKATVPAAEGGYGLQMFTIRRVQGRLAEVVPVLQLAASNAGGVWAPGLASLLVEVGRADDARAHYERLAADDFASIARDSLWPAALSFLADVCIALDDTERAPLLYDEMLVYRNQNLMVALTICFGPADRWLGGLAGLLGLAPDAEAHFQVACDLADQSGSPVWRAEAAARLGPLPRRS